MFWLMAPNLPIPVPFSQPSTGTGALFATTYISKTAKQEALLLWEIITIYYYLLLPGDPSISGVQCPVSLNAARIFNLLRRLLECFIKFYSLVILSLFVHSAQCKVQRRSHSAQGTGHRAQGTAAQRHSGTGTGTAFVAVEVGGAVQPSHHNHNNHNNNNISHKSTYLAVAVVGSATPSALSALTSCCI